MNLSIVNIPLFFTLIRLIFSPIILPFLLNYFLPMQIFYINCAVGIIFVLFGLTDFLDGFFARRYSQETEWGSILDPIADKFLLFSTIITLVYLKKFYFFYAIIFIAREFFIISLRQIGESQKIKLNVIQSAKLKTFTQLTYLFWLIVNPYQGLSAWHIFNLIETILLICSLYLTIFSIVQYYLTFVKQLGEIK